MNSSKFKHLLESRRKDYKKYDPMYCPCLRRQIIFNMSGFNHLRFKTNNTPRNPREAMYKLGLLPLVRPVIYNSKKVSAYRRKVSPIIKSKQKVLKEIEYWSLVSKVGKNQDVKIRVILRKIGNGNIHFWSVMKLTK